MHSHMCYNRSACPRMVYIFFLHLSERPLLGLVGKLNYPPICLHLPSGAAFIQPFGCFVLQFIPNLGYLIVLASQPCTIWEFTWGLRSVLGGPLIDQFLQPFWRGFRSCWKFFLVVPAQSGLSVLSGLIRGLCSCFRVSGLWPLIWWRSFGVLIFPKVPGFLGGSPKILEGMLFSTRDIPESFFPAFGFIVSFWRSFQLCSSLLSGGLLGVVVFPCVLWGGENKI